MSSLVYSLGLFLQLFIKNDRSAIKFLVLVIAIVTAFSTKGLKVLLSGLSMKGLTDEVAYHNAKMSTHYPRLFEVDIFRNFQFHSNKESTYLVSVKNVIYYLFHLREFKRDLLITRWKIGFLKSCLF